MLFWIYVFYNVWFFEYVSYAGICGSKIRSFGITRKHYMGAWKIISAHLPCGVYTFEKGCPLVLRCGICFTAGVFLAASMLNMGIRGIVFFTMSLFPHCLFYLMVLLLIFGVDTHSFYNRKNPVVKRVIYYGVVGIVFLLGCISEVMISVPLLQKVIRLICT